MARQTLLPFAQPTTRASPPPPPKTLDALPDKVKHKIFGFAGREAIFAYLIAAGNQEFNKPYIKENAFYEPFTYWDWHLTDDIFQEDDKLKRRLFWEREKAFKKDGQWHAYPSPQKRWIAFKKQVEKNKGVRQCMKKIAVARWMTLKDIEWICEELPALEALDLSDVETREGVTQLTYKKDTTNHGLASPRWQDIFEVLWNSTPVGFNDYEEALPPGMKKARAAQWKPKVKRILNRLTWLGLCNEGRPFQAHGIDVNGETVRRVTPVQDAFSIILPECKNLTTLSLRASHGYEARYWGQMPTRVDEPIHYEVCGPIMRIAKNAPDSVRTLELRHYFDFLPIFLEHLSRLKPTIKQVGIDLGAWVQVYPLRPTQIDPGGLFITDEEIQRTSLKAARWTAGLAGKTKNNNAPAQTPAELIYRKSNNETKQLQAMKEKPLRDQAGAKKEYRKQKNGFYCNNGGTSKPYEKKILNYAHLTRDEYPRKDDPSVDIADCTVAGHHHGDIAMQLYPAATTTLLRMLKMLFELRNHRVTLFALDPEPQTRSTDPVHPLALVQSTDEVGCHTWAMEDNHFNCVTECGDMFKWLNETFNWRPVFDWDWFMIPERMADTVDPAYKKMVWNEKYMTRLERKFKALRRGDIPVHLLIGRRKEPESSLYWGWPYTEKKWQSWLNRSFHSNLTNIAGYVDILSIFYDLRDPLDETRLEDIEAVQPVRRPLALCPKVPCPWGATAANDPGTIDFIPGLSSTTPKTAHCPFHAQRTPLGKRKPKTKQKMANKHPLVENERTPTNYARLANSSASAPPVGENANDHDSEDSELEEDRLEDGDTQLHYLARKAAYLREGVGWHRFWSTYALKFTKLKVMRLRMPKGLDDIGSWRLAKLLPRNAGWCLFTFTDERAHLQTDEDLVRHLQGVPHDSYEHRLEAPVWPSGRFVRRSWVWPAFRVDWNESGNKTEIIVKGNHPHWHEERWTKEDWEEGKPHEARELEDAVQKANEAAQRELEAESRLDPDRAKLNQRQKERRHKNRLYYRVARNMAQEHWQSNMQGYIDTISEQLWKSDQDKQPWDSRLEHDIRWLKLRQSETTPIFGIPSNDNVDERNVKWGMGLLVVKSASLFENTMRSERPHWFASRDSPPYRLVNTEHETENNTPKPDRPLPQPWEQTTVRPTTTNHPPPSKEVATNLAQTKRPRREDDEFGVTASVSPPFKKLRIEGPDGVPLTQGTRQVEQLEQPRTPLVDETVSVGPKPPSGSTGIPTKPQGTSSIRPQNPSTRPSVKVPKKHPAREARNTLLGGGSLMAEQRRRKETAEKRDQLLQKPTPTQEQQFTAALPQKPTATRPQQATATLPPQTPTTCPPQLPATRPQQPTATRPQTGLSTNPGGSITTSVQNPRGIVTNNTSQPVSPPPRPGTKGPGTKPTEGPQAPTTRLPRKRRRDSIDEIIVSSSSSSPSEDETPDRPPEKKHRRGEEEGETPERTRTATPPPPTKNAPSKEDGGVESGEGGKKDTPPSSPRLPPPSSSSSDDEDGDRPTGRKDPVRGGKTPMSQSPKPAVPRSPSPRLDPKPPSPKPPVVEEGGTKTAAPEPKKRPGRPHKVKGVAPPPRTHAMKTRRQETEEKKKEAEEAKKKKGAEEAKKKKEAEEAEKKKEAEEAKKKKEAEEAKKKKKEPQKGKKKGGRK